MSAVAEFLDHVASKTAALRDEFAHLVNWGTFERAAAVVTELERELKQLGLPVAPVEALTVALVDVVEAVHGHVVGAKAAAAELSQDELREQIAALTARLQPDEPAAPAAAVPGGFTAPGVD